MALLLYSTAVKQYIITTAAAVRTESGHTKKPQITQITETKKNRLRLSISKKEAKGKKKLKLDPRKIRTPPLPPLQVQKRALYRLSHCIRRDCLPPPGDRLSKIHVRTESDYTKANQIPETKKSYGF